MTNNDNKVLTRNDLAKIIRSDMPTISNAYDFVAHFFDVLSEQIAANEELKIHGFGRFRCIHKKSRIGRNPKTGEEVVISSRRVVSFVASGKFKRVMLEGNEKS